MKKLLATLLASTMTLSAIGGLVACGGDSGSSDDANTITVWAPTNSLGSEATGKGYRSMIAGWKEAYPEYAKYNVKFVAKGEGDVNGAIGNNAKAAAEIFFFASDHYKDLAQNKALQPLTQEYVTKVHGRDVQGTYEFVTDSENNLYAFPATNDNGFFLWYNDTIYDEDDVVSLDKMLAKSKEKGVHINFPYDNSWYSASFMFGMGCKFNYDENGHYKGDTATPEAKAAVKAMFKYANDPNNKGVISEEDEDGETVWTDVIVSAASFNAGMADGTIGAAVSYVSSYADIEAAITAVNTDEATGAVNQTKIDEQLSHIKATVLPKFKATIEGGTEQEYNMGTFYGGKYCGVNRSKPEAKIKAALSLADWFTNENGQKVRFAADYSGPSNKVVAELDEVKNNMGLKAYNAQVGLGPDVNCVQGKQSDEFWGDSGIKAFVTGIFLHEKDTATPPAYDYTTEAGVLAQLAKLAAAIKAE